MAKNYDIITMGSSLVDAYVYPVFKEDNNLIKFLVGTKILLDNINFTIGGGGSNSAICFSKLGLKAGFLGKIGGGYNAKIILKELEKNKVDFLGVEGVEHTGYSIILSTNKGNRTILSFKGASDNLKFREIELRKLKTKWFYFTSMGNESFKSQKKIALFASRKEVKLAYNPSSYHTKNGALYLKDILKYTYFLSLNKEEAEMLVNRGDLYRGLRKLGPKIVCVTNGNREGGVYDGKFLYRYWPNKVKVVDATGAGDVFGSSFVTGLIKLDNIKEAIKMAMANTESLIQIRGAHNGLLSWNELMKVIKTRKFIVKKQKL